MTRSFFVFALTLSFGCGPASTQISQSGATVAQSGSIAPDTGQSASRIAYQPRTWKTNDGKFSVEAELVNRTDSAVDLKRVDNSKVVTVQIEKLSDADRSYLDELSTLPVEKRSSIELHLEMLDSDGNCLKAFAVKRSLKLDDFIEVCRQAKNDPCGRIFTVIVLFDNKKNVSKSSTPVPAAYGNDFDGAILRHIRAMYTFNRLNGFSELAIYKPNMWEGKATRSKL